MSARPVGEPAGPGLSVAKTLRFRGKVGKDPKVLLSGGIAGEVVCSCPTKAGVDHRILGLLRFRETKPFGVGETAGSSGSRPLRESTGGAPLEHMARTGEPAGPGLSPVNYSNPGGFAGLATWRALRPFTPLGDGLLDTHFDEERSEPR